MRIFILILLLSFVFLFTIHLFRIPEILCINRPQLTEPKHIVFFTTLKNIIINFFKYTIYYICPMLIHIALPISSSMIPTYHVGDAIYCIPYSINVHKIGIPILKNILFFIFPHPITIMKPQVGDCCIFKVPFSNLPFSKRIIAKGGDTVYINGHILAINGVICPTRFLREETIEDSGIKYHLHIYERELPNGVKHEIAIDERVQFNTNIDNNIFYGIVPEGHYMVQGDNIDNSDDSKSLLSYINGDDIFDKLGPVIIRSPHARSIGEYIINIVKARFGILV